MKMAVESRQLDCCGSSLAICVESCDVSRHVTVERVVADSA